MKRFRSNVAACLLLAFSAFVTSCRKEPSPVPPTSLQSADPKMLTDWFEMSLLLSSRVNGYSDPVTARALSYMALTMYENVIPALPEYKSLQNRVGGFQTQLSQGDPELEYNYGLVYNRAMLTLAKSLYGAAGSSNLDLLEKMYQNWVTKLSLGIDSNIVHRSILLGAKRGSEIYNFSTTDGQDAAFLQNYIKDYTLPQSPGMWVPTPPDYSPNPLLPYWGRTRTILTESISSVSPTKILAYSPDPNSIMYTEAFEAYQKSTNLSQAEVDLLDYYNGDMDPKASAICHTSWLLLQLCESAELNFTQTLEAICLLSWSNHDAMVAAYQQKYTYKLMRPSTYIRTFIQKFFIPPVSSQPTPEFVSDDAVVYYNASEILSRTFGYRYEFMDYTQAKRTNLRVKQKYFSSFHELAKEASFIDLTGSVHFRTSIEEGAAMGYDIAQNYLKLALK